MGGDAVVHEVQEDAAHIFDVNEVAGLVSVLVILAMTSEELHAACRLHLPKGVQHDRRHPGFVEFVGAVDVEEFESRPEVGLSFLGQGPLVEVVFRPAIGIEGLELGDHLVVVHVAQVATAVRRG